MFGALVPLLMAFALSGALAHQLSLGVIVAAHIGCLAHGLLSVAKSPGARREYAPGVVAGLMSGGAIVIVLSIASAVGVMGYQELLILLNLVWLLFVAVVNFVQLLISGGYGDEA